MTLTFLDTILYYDQKIHKKCLGRCWINIHSRQLALNFRPYLPLFNEKILETLEFNFDGSPTILKPLYINLYFSLNKLGFVNCIKTVDKKKYIWVW